MDQRTRQCVRERMSLGDIASLRQNAFERALEAFYPHTDLHFIQRINGLRALYIRRGMDPDKGQRREVK